jgi:cytochrome b561
MKDYSSLSKAVHWVTVLCVFPQVVLGVIIANQMEALFSQAVIAKFVDLHRSLGATILVLGILRVVAHYLGFPGGSLPSLTPFERLASSIVHCSLAVLILLVPTLGWLATSAEGGGVSVFGLFTLPAILPKNVPLSLTLFGAHKIAAVAMTVIVLVHAGAALMHAIVKNDGVMQRMLPRFK